MERIGLQAILDDADFQKGINGYTSSLDKAESHTKGVASSIGDHLGKMGGAVANLGATAAKLTFGVAVAGAAALGGVLVAGVKAAMESQQVHSQLVQVLESTGGAAGMSVEALDDLANSLSQVTPIEDDAITAGEAMLLTFTNIGKDVFPRTTETLLDMATAMNSGATPSAEQLKAQAIQLGKALNDPIKGVSALTKVGVTFTEQQKEQIKAMVEAGNVAGAQTLILDELAKEFGGSAVAAGQTFSGQLTILKNTLGNVAETIGMALLPALTDIARILVSVLNGPEVQAAIATLSSILMDLAAGDVKQALADFFYFFTEGWLGNGAAGTMSQAQEVISAAMDVIGQAITFFTTNILPVLQAGFQMVLEWVTANWPMIQSIIETVFSAIGAAISFIITDVLPVLIAAFQDVWSFVQVVWPTVQQIITLAIQAIALIITTTMGAVQTFWNDNGQTILSIAVTIWDMIKNAIQTAMGVIQGVIKLVMDVIHGDWSAVWTDIWDIITIVWNGIKTAVGLAIDLLKLVISVAMDVIKKTIKEVWEDIKGLIADAWLKILGGVRAKIADVVVAMKLRWDQMYNEVITAWKNVTSAVSDRLNDVLRAVQEFSLVEAGRNLIQGLANGVTAAAGAIADAVRRAVQGAINAALSALGIGSPSKVFYGIGTETGQGFVDGILALKPAVEEATGLLGRVASMSIRRELEKATRLIVPGITETPGGLTIGQPPSIAEPVEIGQPPSIAEPAFPDIIKKIVDLIIQDITETPGRLTIGQPPSIAEPAFPDIIKKIIDLIPGITETPGGLTIGQPPSIAVPLEMIQPPSIAEPWMAAGGTTVINNFNLSANYANTETETSLRDTVRLLQMGAI